MTRVPSKTSAAIRKREQRKNKSFRDNENARRRQMRKEWTSEKRTEELRKDRERKKKAIEKRAEELLEARNAAVHAVSATSESPVRHFKRNLPWIRNGAENRSHQERGNSVENESENDFAQDVPPPPPRKETRAGRVRSRKVGMDQKWI